jgi:hypothetical protein
MIENMIKTSGINTKMIVSRILKDNLVIDNRMNYIAYPMEKIEKLMEEGNLEEAQQVYFEYLNNQREEIIRL